MSELLNAVPRISPEMGEVTGTLLVTGTTPTLSQLSGFVESDQAQLTVSRTSTGIFVISVQNFRGLNGYIAAFTTPTTLSTTACATTQAYTANTDTAVFTFTVKDDTGTLSDTGFNFILRAF